MVSRSLPAYGPVQSQRPDPEPRSANKKPRASGKTIGNAHFVTSKSMLRCKLVFRVATSRSDPVWGIPTLDAIFEILLRRTRRLLYSQRFGRIKSNSCLTLTACAQSKTRNVVIAVAKNCNCDCCTALFSSITGIRHIKANRRELLQHDAHHAFRRTSETVIVSSKIGSAPRHRMMSAKRR